MSGSTMSAWRAVDAASITLFRVLVGGGGWRREGGEEEER